MHGWLEKILYAAMHLLANRQSRKFSVNLSLLLSLVNWAVISMRRDKAPE